MVYIYFRKDTRCFSHSSETPNGGDWLYEFAKPDGTLLHNYTLSEDDNVTVGEPLIFSESVFDIVEFEMQALRAARNEKLAATDWMAVSDRSMTDAQKRYRQDLRDLTIKYSKVADTVWPVVNDELKSTQLPVLEDN